MGVQISKLEFDRVLSTWNEKYVFYAPKLFKDAGAFSDTDQVRYDHVTSIDEIIFDKKTHFSFKEVILPITQRLFFFTEGTVKEAEMNTRELIVLLRSCDLHAVRRLDEVYLKGKFEDPYYKAFREKTKFIVMGCQRSFASCFCVDMGTNQSTEFDGYLHIEDGQVHLELNDAHLMTALGGQATDLHIEPKFVKENDIHVKVPNKLNLDAIYAEMWEEYSARCIGCGRCNFSCPTCTCFTTQDVCYKDNPSCGERRRVWAGCQTDGFTDMAGGHTFRETKGQRMRFKTMHKIYDFKKRYGYHMCVGCGRCDDVCPEYISFSTAINKLNSLVEEAGEHV